MLKIKFFSYTYYDNVIGSIITEKLASLIELQTVYSYEDALGLYDLIITNRANETLKMNHLEKKAKSRK